MSACVRELMCLPVRSIAVSPHNATNTRNRVWQSARNMNRLLSIHQSICIAYFSSFLLFYLFTFLKLFIFWQCKEKEHNKMRKCDTKSKRCERIKKWIKSYKKEKHNSTVNNLIFAHTFTAFECSKMKLQKESTKHENQYKRNRDHVRKE